MKHSLTHILSYACNYTLARIKKNKNIKNKNF